MKLSTTPIEIPLKPSEAAALAELLFPDPDNRPITDDVRDGLAIRAAELGLSSFHPCFASLEKDSTQPGTYYLMVDAALHGAPQTYLLRFALASASAGELFRDPIHIGRMRPAGEREVVVSAVPFRPSDRENIRLFTVEVDRSFLPQPVRSGEAAAIEIMNPDLDIPAAFANAAAELESKVRFLVLVVPNRVDPEHVLAVAVWSAIRAGWRSGYSIESASKT